MIIISFFILGLFSFLYLDKSLMLWIFNNSLEIKFAWMKYVTILGEGAIYLIFIPILWFLNRHKKLLAEKIIYVWTVLFSCNLIALILKMTLGRARPNMYISEHVYGLHGFTLNSNFWSLPSGHTITLVALLLTFGVVFSAWRKYLVILTIVTIISRLVLLKHYLSDILFATSLDILIFYAINGFIYKQKYLPRLLKYIESNPKLLARFIFSK